MLPSPLENGSFTEVQVRVAYRVLQMDVRRYPSRYDPYPPAGIQYLAELYRNSEFTFLYWCLTGCARWVADGYTTLQWKEAALIRPEGRAMRALHKRRLLR